MEDDDTEVTLERNPKTAKRHAKSTYEMQCVSCSKLSKLGTEVRMIDNL